MVPLFGHTLLRELCDARLTQAKALQWALAERLLGLGVNVVLDWGFWTRREWDAARQRGEASGAEVWLLVFDVPVDELGRSLDACGRDLPPGTFELDRAALDLFGGSFEAQQPAEGAASS